MSTGRVVVIGASSGGTPPIEALLQGLGADLPATVLIVRHIPPYADDRLPAAFSRGCPLPVALAGDGAPLEPGLVLVAPADRHLLVDADRVRLSRGPRENRTRPAIDPLFRSAALSHGPRAIGVVLSGRLDDGTAGLLALKQSGGIAVVQDPDDARCPDMPESALRHVAVDHCLPATEIGPLLTQLVRADGPPEEVVVPEELTSLWRREIDVLRRSTGDIATAQMLGEVVPASCPECGGPLWQLEDGIPRYRCHTGHAFTGRHLSEGLGEAAEQALWAALRALEERARMLRRLAERDPSIKTPGLVHQAFRERAEEADRHVAALRALLADVPAAGAGTGVVPDDLAR